MAFPKAIDECTHTAAFRAGKKDTNSIISVVERDMFKDIKANVSDNSPAFEGKGLQQ